MTKKILIWNTHWGTAGGGERYAVTLGKVLQKNKFLISFAGPSEKEMKKLFTTFGLAYFPYSFIEVSKESDVAEHAKKHDIFVNGSYGSGMFAPIPNSIYICHFPTHSRRGRLSNRFNKKLFDHTISLNAIGAVQNPQLNSQLWFNELLFVHMQANSSIDIQALEGDFQIWGKNISKIIKFGEKTRLYGPNDLVIGGGSANKFSGTITGIESISGWRALLSRLLPNSVSPNSYSQVWANSEFTRKWISTIWKCESYVIQPPVELNYEDNLNKNEYAIMSLGRFMSPKHHHSKNQLELIKALGNLRKIEPKFELTLLGGLADNQRIYFDKILKMTKKIPVRIIENASSQEVRNTMNSSQFFWHAAGLGQPLSKPENFEHFGIAPIEAMSSGLIPLVYREGGPAEVLADFPDLIYDNLSDLVKKTLKLSKSDNRVLIDNLKKLSNKYSEREFEKKVLEAFGIFS